MSIKRLMKFLFILIINATVIGQEKTKEKPKFGWQSDLVGNINLTQTSFDNWKQGGENSIAWQLNLNFKFLNDQQKYSWSNSGKFTYGSTKTSGQEIKKSIDEIKLESVFTYKLAKFINPFAAATGESQFAAGYDYGLARKKQVSAFMDPGYFRESFGMGYKPNEMIQTRLGAALKQTITSHYPAPYADDPTTIKTEKTKNELGVESVTDINWKVSENSLLTSKLELFSAMKALNETDVNWDTFFSAKIAKYVNINFNLKLFYDKDISSKRQIKQAIAFGLTYTFL